MYMVSTCTFWNGIRHKASFSAQLSRVSTDTRRWWLHKADAQRSAHEWPSQAIFNRALAVQRACTEDIKHRTASLPVLIFSMFAEDDYTMSALEAGAIGYLPKNSAPEEILEAVRRASRGERGEWAGM